LDSDRDVSSVEQGPRGLPWLTLALIVASIGALGHAIQINNGNYHPEAIAWLGLTILLLFVAMLPLRLTRLESRGPALVRGAIVLVLVAQVVALVTTAPVPHWNAAIDLLPYRLMTGVAGAAAVAIVIEPRSTVIAFPVLICGFAGAGAFVLLGSPEPLIDVYIVHSDSADALLRGVNPYAITFPDIYGGSSFYYGPGQVHEGRTTWGFPYPPLSLLAALPGHALTGDFRFSQLAAMVAAALLIGFARSGSLPKAAAALLLLTPRSFFVLEQGWTEPFVVLALAAVLFVATRVPRSTWLPLGLLIGSKQYAPLLLPLVPLLVRRNDGSPWRIAVGALAVAGAVALPFVLWGPPAFLNSVVSLQLGLPFRPDSLSFPAWLAQDGVQRLPTWLAWVALAAIVVVALWRWRHTEPATFAVMGALALLVFFSLNRQAFCNYYFLVIGALACGLAAVESSAPDPARSPRSPA
jgi:hypothetical protein